MRPENAQFDRAASSGLASLDLLRVLHNILILRLHVHFTYCVTSLAREIFISTAGKNTDYYYLQSPGFTSKSFVDLFNILRRHTTPLSHHCRVGVADQAGGLF
jgi:hypothetical protein